MPDRVQVKGAILKPNGKLQSLVVEQENHRTHEVPVGGGTSARFMFGLSADAASPRFDVDLAQIVEDGDEAPFGVIGRWSGGPYKLTPNGTISLLALATPPGYEIVAGRSQIDVGNAAGTQLFEGYFASPTLLPVGTPEESAQINFDSGYGIVGSDLSVSAGSIKTTAGGVFFITLQMKIRPVA